MVGVAGFEPAAPASLGVADGTLSEDDLTTWIRNNIQELI
jgi:hypothetical protein